MSFKNNNSLNKNISHSNNFPSNKVIESYVSLNDRKKHPEISLVLKSDRKFRFGLLSPLKPKLTDTKGIHNENKLKLINRINSFRKIYFNNNRNIAFSMKEIRTLKKENNFFSRNYNLIKEKSGENKKIYFNEIKEEYEKKNYYVPPIVGNKKNLFKGNILLYNDNELKDFILYDIGTNKSNQKSLSFLEKIQSEVLDKGRVKEGNPKFVLYKNPLLENKNYIDKIKRDKKKEIKLSKSEIKKVRNTINLIDEIDYFFNSDNRQYLNKLKYESSRESSAKISTRVNSAMGLFENIKKRNNLNLYNLINNNENLNTENTNLTNNVINTTKNKVYPLEINKDSIVSDYKNIKPLTERNDNKIKIKELKKDNSFENKNKLDNKRKIKIKKRHTKKFDKEVFKSTLERLYDKLTKKKNNNLLTLNYQINKYIHSHKNNFSSNGIKDISQYNICNKVEKARQKICNENYIKDDISLRKINGSSMNTINNLSKKDSRLKENITNIESKMIKMYCDLDNPKNINQ